MAHGQPWILPLQRSLGSNLRRLGHTIGMSPDPAENNTKDKNMMWIFKKFNFMLKENRQLSLQDCFFGKKNSTFCAWTKVMTGTVLHQTSKACCYILPINALNGVSHRHLQRYQPRDDYFAGITFEAENRIVT